MYSSRRKDLCRPLHEVTRLPSFWLGIILVALRLFLAYEIYAAYSSHDRRVLALVLLPLGIYLTYLERPLLIWRKALTRLGKWISVITTISTTALIVWTAWHYSWSKWHIILCGIVGITCLALGAAMKFEARKDSGLYQDPYGPWALYIGWHIMFVTGALVIVSIDMFDIWPDWEEVFVFTTILFCASVPPIIWRRRMGLLPLG